MDLYMTQALLAFSIGNTYFMALRVKLGLFFGFIT